MSSELASSAATNSKTEEENNKKKAKRKAGFWFWVIALLAMLIKFIWNGFEMAFKELMEWIIGILMASGLIDAY